MSQTTLTATPRTGSGSPTARRLRAEGHIPGVLYGRGMEPISVTVERREFRLALSYLIRRRRETQLQRARGVPREEGRRHRVIRPASRDPTVVGGLRVRPG